MATSDTNERDPPPARCAQAKIPRQISGRPPDESRKATRVAKRPVRLRDTENTEIKKGSGSSLQLLTRKRRMGGRQSQGEANLHGFPSQPNHQSCCLPLQPHLEAPPGLENNTPDLSQQEIQASNLDRNSRLECDPLHAMISEEHLR